MGLSNQALRTTLDWFDPHSDETPEDVKPDISRYDG